MYQIAEIIENDRTPSHVAEVSFHPSGSYFAATYEYNNEVRIFDSRTRKLLQVIGNPEGQLDCPHGVLFTEKYLLISNGHDFSKPGTINVYRNDDGTIKQPIQIFRTPFRHLREPHSLALRHGRLVVTYAENVAPAGAIVSYAFNDETGKITGPLDKTESWFAKHGDPKGICFNADGTKIFVTFESEEPISPLKMLYWRLRSDRGLPPSTRLRKFAGSLAHESARAFIYPVPAGNGIAIFSIDAGGKIGRRPDQVILREQPCRLENIAIRDGTCAVTDTLNGQVLLYDLARDQNFTSPLHTENFGKATPHAAKFSPDGKWLVISSLGRKVVNQQILWEPGVWESPREDKLFVLERSI